MASLVTTGGYSSGQRVGEYFKATENDCSGVFHRSIPFKELGADGVVREPAGDAKRGFVDLLHDANDLGVAAQDDVVLGRFARFLDGDQEFTLESFEGRKAPVSDAKETLTTDVLSFRFRPGNLSGTVKTQWIRQPQATAATPIRSVAGRQDRQHHRGPTYLMIRDTYRSTGTVGFTRSRR